MLKLKTYLCLLLGILCLAACDTDELWLDDSKVFHWQEQVQLSDGKVIWIERRIAGNGGFLPDSDFEATKDEVEVVDAAGLDEPPLWSDRWAPMILDRDEQGNWYMVVSPIYSKGWNNRCPYRKYQVVNGAWQPVAFDQRLFGRRPNIEWYIRLKEMPEKLYLIDKPEWESDPRSSRVSRARQGISTQYRTGC